MSLPDKTQNNREAFLHYLLDTVTEKIGAMRDENLIGPWKPVRPARKIRKTNRLKLLYDGHHAHVHAEISFILSGGCILKYGTEYIRFGEGDAAFFISGIEHSEAFFRRNSPYRTAWFILLEDNFNCHITDHMAGRSFSAMSSVNSAYGYELQQNWHEILQSLQNGEEPDIIRLKEFLLGLVLNLAHQIKISLAQNEGAENSLIIAKVDHFIRQNMDKKISVSDAGNAVMLTPNYLTALFHKIKGVPLGRYIKECKIKSAANLLGATSLRIKEIADRLGFADQYVFSRTFKTIIGVSPAVFRKNIRR